MKYTHERLLKICVFFYLIGWLIGSLWLMAVLRSGTLDGTHVLGVNIQLLKNYLYYTLSGAIGGTIYVMRMFHDHYHALQSKWFYWYLMRPILCAATACMTIILFKSGIMLLQISDNLTAKIGLAFLVGYGFGKFVDKLKALTITLFDGSELQNGNGLNGTYEPNGGNGTYEPNGRNSNGQHSAGNGSNGNCSNGNSNK